MTKTAMKKRNGCLALLLLAVSMAWTHAVAQNAPGRVATPPAPTVPAGGVAPAGTTTDCPTRAEALPAQALHGHWQVAFDGVDRASVVLHQHPDYEGSVRGTITRAGLVAQLAGDIGDDGLLTFDESQDGLAISATWSGDMQAASCGREFTGLWRNARDDSTRDFVLRKTANGN